MSERNANYHSRLEGKWNIWLSGSYARYTMLLEEYRFDNRMLAIFQTGVLGHWDTWYVISVCKVNIPLKSAHGWVAWLNFNAFSQFLQLMFILQSWEQRNSFSRIVLPAFYLLYLSNLSMIVGGFCLLHLVHCHLGHCLHHSFSAGIQSLI